MTEVAPGISQPSRASPQEPNEYRARRERIVRLAAMGHVSATKLKAEVCVLSL
jgi:hypothetical protein